MAAGIGQDLAVEDAVPGQAPRRLDYLGELVADVVQVARVQARLAAPAVELGADAVVLVLDPDQRPQARQDLGRILGRGGEHELDGVAQPQARLVQAPLFGEDRRLANVPGEHPRQLHLGRRSLERFGDGRLQQPLAQSDAQLAGEDLDHVLGGDAIAAPQQRAEDRALGRGSGSRFDRRESLRHFHNARGVARVRLFGSMRQDVGDGHAQVRGAIVGLAQGPGRGTCDLRHGR